MKKSTKTIFNLFKIHFCIIPFISVGLSTATTPQNDPNRTTGGCGCIDCNGTEITVDQNVTVNFNVNPPVCSGDADLTPFFTYDISGPTADTWKAIFDVGAYKLVVKNGATITVLNFPNSSNNQVAPGITIKSTCDMEVENGGHIVVNSVNQRAGDITVEVNGHININGEVRDQVSGTNNMPGAISISSACGNINVGQTGVVEVRGTGGGGNAINLSTCESICNTGDITINGLIKSFTKNTVNSPVNIARIGVVSFKGKVIINANTVHPLYPNFQESGTTYNIYGGLLAWTRDNAVPGKIEVQAGDSVIVNGHGFDPTGSSYSSFGAIAAISTMSSAPGGIIEVRSIGSSIVGNDRAFDVSGRNLLTKNYANILLWAKNNIVINRLGANNTFNPVIDATGKNVGDKGGKNILRAFTGNIIIGANALVSAAVPIGTNSIQGGNFLTSCGLMNISGTVTPADLITADDFNVCSPASPDSFFTDCSLQKVESCDCIDCSGNNLIVDQDVTIDFNGVTPLCTGDLDLVPFFTYDNSGLTADTWKAIFDVGANKLILKNGATITVNNVPMSSNNQRTPGIVFKSTCDMVIEDNAHIVLNSLNKKSGDIKIQVNGHITIDGEIRNQLSGTNDVPGAISVTSACGNITAGPMSLIQVLGTGGGGNTISLVTCESSCNTGDIIINGLVKSYTHNTANLATNRPNVRVVSFNGKVVVNTNSAEPMFDEFQESGTRYDIYRGILSWTRDNSIPGKIEVQAKDSVIVNGHGIDNTAPVRKSFGALAAVATASSAPGGIIDVHSLNSSIVGNDRAFDVSGRNRLALNYANINLWAKNNIVLDRPGANNNSNPVVDASSPTVGDKGGLNTLRAFSGGILIGTNATVSGSVPVGSGTVQGTNLLASCTGLTYAPASVVPSDLVPGDDNLTCSPAFPGVIYSDCALGSVVRLASGESYFTDPFKSIVYPNPASDKITVEFNSLNIGNCTLQLVDMTGRIVIRNQFDVSEGKNTHEINLSNIEKSIYIIVLEIENLKQQYRIVVQ